VVLRTDARVAPATSTQKAGVSPAAAAAAAGGEGDKKRGFVSKLFKRFAS
jgi:hypothetical protein